MSNLRPTLDDHGLRPCVRCSRNGTTPGCDDCHHTGRLHLTTLVVTEEHPGYYTITIKHGPPGTAMVVAASARVLDAELVDTVLADLRHGSIHPSGPLGIVIQDRRPS